MTPSLCCPPPLHASQMFYKSARVEYVPVGVVGAIVPWNYPFHNIFNPLTAALFAGNAIVVKVGPGLGCALGGGLAGGIGIGWGRGRGSRGGVCECEAGNWCSSGLLGEGTGGWG